MTDLKLHRVLLLSKGTDYLPKMVLLGRAADRIDAFAVVQTIKDLLHYAGQFLQDGLELSLATIQQASIELDNQGGITF